jgi:general secretion pathway protein I
MPRRSKGFTLLEAIVALVIISGAGMALFGWINDSINTLQRLQQNASRNAATRNAIEFMQSVNPMLTPNGERDFGAYRVHWEADATTSIHDGVGYPSGQDIYQFALYHAHVVAITADDPHWVELDMKLVGYKKVRDAVSVLGTALPSPGAGK